MGFIHFAILILGSSVTTGNACSCYDPDSAIPVRVCGYDVVFRGTALEETLVGNSLFGTRIYHINVTKSFMMQEGTRGENGIIHLKTEAAGSMCGKRFRLNQDTLFIARYRHGEVWTTLCLPNTEWSKLNTEELRILNTERSFRNYCSSFQERINVALEVLGDLFEQYNNL